MSSEEFVRHLVDELNIDKERLEKPKTVWDLQKGDSCCYIDQSGDLEYATWDETEELKNLRSLGQLYMNDEELVSDVKRRRIETQLKRYGGLPFYDLHLYTCMEEMYVIEFSNYLNSRDASRPALYCSKMNEIVNLDNIIPYAFASENSLWKAIDLIGEQPLMEYAASGCKRPLL
jgi:hypothetical protein